MNINIVVFLFLFFTIFIVVLFIISISRIENNINNQITSIKNETEKINNIFLKNYNSLKSDLIHSIDLFSKQNNNLIKIFQDSLSEKINNFFDFYDKKLLKIENNQDKAMSNINLELKSIYNIIQNKLDNILTNNLGESFKNVNYNLQKVQTGLMEMKSLVRDVSGLKRILTNVKMSGSFSELQLSMLLSQILSPDQYEANVKTKPGSSYSVEFAIKLPGNKNTDSVVWIPIDAKFPKDVYKQLQDSYDKGNIIYIKKAKKKLDIVIKKMAKDINSKYINPPNTTDFGILFLPFEGLYMEVVKNNYLLEFLQRNHKVIVTGPTTLAAILNSLQIGFKSLMIEKRSSEVWDVLISVKNEFNKFFHLLDSAKKNINTASRQMDEVIGRRTRMIKKKLNNIEIIKK